MTYRDILRATVYVEFRENGGKLRLTSKTTGIPVSTICRWKGEKWWSEMANSNNKHKGATEKAHEFSTIKVNSSSFGNGKDFYQRQ